VTLKKSGIKDIAGLKGKRVSIGSPGSGTAFMSNLVFDALGMPPKETMKVRRLSFNENTNALRDGTIDVGIWCVAPGTSSIMDLATTHDIVVLPFNQDEQKKVIEAHNFYSTFDLPGGVYRGVDEPVPTISVWNVIICQAGLDTDLVYNLVKVLFEKNDFMQKIHPFAKYTTPENAVKQCPIPLHPGMIKYLKEKGIAVPDKLIPKG
ncbi:MAG: TAXI family TRAP transporter solute-binding subunit, partial [Deltaproteobacteria bacterium]|nr:TAXI family TRAP transporter solute-binding subunit [Deltaproteobacteria bacterium]